MEDSGVLLAEPDARLRVEWADGLRRCGGLRVLAALDRCAGAADRLAETGAQAVVLGLSPAEPDGLAALAAVRRRFGRRVGVVACAPQSRAAWLERALWLGADAVCLKPVDRFTLAAQVRLALPGPAGRRADALDLRARAALLLRGQGIRPAGPGYRLLIEALALAAEEPEVLAGPAGALVRRAAQRCGLPPDAAARAARETLRRAWERDGGGLRAACFPWHCRCGRAPSVPEMAAILLPRLRAP